MGDNTFVAGQGPWLERLGNLRNVVRQEMVTRQLAAHLPRGPASRPRRRRGPGHAGAPPGPARPLVTAVEPDGACAPRSRRPPPGSTPAERRRVTLVATDLDGLAGVTGPTAYDVVLCHGVLMYLPEQPAPRWTPSLVVSAPGGIVSIVARNGDAMAWRPARRHDWAAALAMLDEVQLAAEEGRDARYHNEIGVDARADTLASLTRRLRGCGPRGLARGTASASPATTSRSTSRRRRAPSWTALLDVEQRLGMTDPYRALGTLLHVIARRTA